MRNFVVGVNLLPCFQFFFFFEYEFLSLAVVPFYMVVRLGSQVWFAASSEPEVLTVLAFLKPVIVFHSLFPCKFSCSLSYLLQKILVNMIMSFFWH